MKNELLEQREVTKVILKPSFKMNKINLSDGELAVLAARIQKNYEYDDRSGLLVNVKTGHVVKGANILVRIINILSFGIKVR